MSQFCYKPPLRFDEKQKIILERRKLIGLLKGYYSVEDLAEIFNVSRSIAYRAASMEERDIALQERLLSNSEFISQINAWSTSIIQYENYFFSNILPMMRLARLPLNRAPKQKWMQKNGFSKFIHAINERKLARYGIKNITGFWKYLGLKLNYEQGIWPVDFGHYENYFNSKILPVMKKEGMEISSSPSTSWLDKKGFSVFRRMVRKRLLMSHNEFFSRVGLSIWERNKWKTTLGHYRKFVARHIFPKLLEAGRSLEETPTTTWLRDNGFRPFLAAIEHGRLRNYNIGTVTEFWSKIQLPI